MLDIRFLLLAQTNTGALPEWLQALQNQPVWFWISTTVSLFVAMVAFGDNLAGVLNLWGIESPFRRPSFPESALPRLRRELLRRLEGDVNKRLTTSLHRQIELDLDMKLRGEPKLCAQDASEASRPILETLVNRLFQPIKAQWTRLTALDAQQKIVSIFDLDNVQGKMLILGEPGSGKTTEVLHLAKDLIQRAAKDEVLPIPLVLELSGWNNGALEDWIPVQAKKQYDIAEDITRQWLQRHEILLLLDGLDELGLVRQRECIDAINAFAGRNLLYGLVVCCRRREYEASPVQLEAVRGIVYLEPLRNEQIQKYLQQLNRPDLWQQVQAHPDLLELARYPLFLVMLVVAHEDEEQITNETELFDVYIATKLHQDDQPKSYSPQQTCHYLGWLAQQLKRVGTTEFLIEDLQPSWLPSDRQRWLYQWSVGLLFGLPVGLLTGLFLGLPIGLIAGLVAKVFVGLLVGQLVKQKTKPIQVVEKLEFSFPRALRSGLSSGLLAGTFSGLLFGLLVALLIEPRFSLLAGLFFGLFIGLLFGYLNALFDGISVSIIEQKNTPNQGIQKSRQNFLTVLLLMGFPVGLLVELFFRVFAWKFIGIFVGVLFGLLLGMPNGLLAVTQHFVLRFILTYNSNIPRNYAHFLEHAVNLRFIQRIGGRYRFVHDLLRDHFAAMPLER